MTSLRQASHQCFSLEAGRGEVEGPFDLKSLFSSLECAVLGF